MRAFFQYLLTVNIFNFIASLILSVAFGLGYFPVLFCTFGLGVGIIVYGFYFKQQYYFYYNLGFTRAKLVRMAFVTNFILSAPFIILLNIL
ncbi:hypothetical protein ACLI09_04710 [Flavobacterium sp. RHBU_24]|uniref:hypothetical protein n=1 Tax=Flavobacterium sp. RHBU_24 TaxID=3391185 RepID=UPI0039853282